MRSVYFSRYYSTVEKCSVETLDTLCWSWFLVIPHNCFYDILNSTDEKNINKSLGSSDHECGSEVIRIAVHMGCKGSGKYSMCMNMYNVLLVCVILWIYTVPLF